VDLSVSGIDRERQMNFVTDERFPYFGFEQRPVRVDLYESKADQSGLLNQPGQGRIHRRFTADKLNGTAPEVRRLNKDILPILRSQTIVQRPIRAGIGIAMEAAQVTLACYLQPQEAK
jgi:hypothetical protein